MRRLRSEEVDVKREEPREFLVSPEDYDLLEGGWYVDSHGYVGRKIPHPDGGQYIGGEKRRKILRLHRLIMARMLGRELVKREDVDHLNHNTRDNRRENLRVCSRQMNVAHRRALQINNTSGFRGVSWNKVEKKFGAKIQVMGKTRNLGLFPTKEAAAARYLEVATVEFGEFLGAVD